MENEKKIENMTTIERRQIFREIFKAFGLQGACEHLHTKAGEIYIPLSGFYMEPDSKVRTALLKSMAELDVAIGILLESYEDSEYIGLYCQAMRDAMAKARKQAGDAVPSE